MSVGPTRGPVQRPGDDRDFTEIFQRLDDLERARGPGGLRIRGPYRITKDDDLATGVDLFTPAQGDVLYDAFADVKEAFDDTAAGSNILRFYVGATTWSHPTVNSRLDLFYADDESGALSIGNPNNNPGQILIGIEASGGYGRFAVPVLESGPLVARCDAFNQDGTTGIGDLYVIAGTPVR